MRHTQCPWVCFVDGDAVFTTYHWGDHIQKTVKAHPECKAFTCVTNRVGCGWQKVDVQDTNDYRYHREVGERRWKVFGTATEDVSNVHRHNVMSGVMILLHRDLWKKIGGFKEDGMLGIDSDFHWRIQKHKERLYLMKGVYLYHWYRGGNRGKKDHLK